jgi:hypothetical protein
LPNGCLVAVGSYSRGGEVNCSGKSQEHNDGSIS